MPSAAVIFATIQRKTLTLLGDVARVFQTPFSGLAAVMWFYFVFSYMAQPLHPVWLGDLPDPDDYTYLSQTLDWLQGQGWFDSVQHRMNPPDGVPIHYTRLAEMPIAAMTLLFRALHFSWRGAALVGALVLPLIYLGCFFAALRWTAEKLVSPTWAGLTGFVALFCPAMISKFAPGQVDHHGLEAMLAIFAVGFSVRVFLQPEQGRIAAAAGVTLAVATAIALEALPWMAITAAVVGLWGIVVGAKTAKAVLCFGAGLVLSGAAFLAIEKAPAHLFERDMLAYSIVYVELMGGIALVLGIVALAARITALRMRLLVGGGAALALGALYLWRYPDLLGGPYGAMDRQLAAMFFANIQEAKPLAANPDRYKLVMQLATLVLAFVTSLYLVWGTRGGGRWAWVVVTALLGSALALSVFYQSRVIIYAQAFSIIPLVALIEHGWGWIGARWDGRRRFWAEIGLVALVGPLSIVFFPGLKDGRPLNTGVVLFPAQVFDDSCEMVRLERVLNAPPYHQRPPQRIISTLNQGPELLFRTPHEVLSAPYHTNVKGNLDALTFFSTTDVEEAHKIARRDKITMIVLCRSVPDMYLHDQGPHIEPLPDGSVRMLPDPSFVGQLIFHHLPDWVVEVKGPPNYLLFEVR